MMLCDRCQETAATVFVTRIAHGHMTTENLCEPCADFDPLLAPGGWTPGLLPPQPSPEMLEHMIESTWSKADLPAEVELPAFITLPKLAEVLHLRLHHVLSLVLRQHLWIKGLMLNFASASLVCAHFGVAVKKAPRTESDLAMAAWIPGFLLPPLTAEMLEFLKQFTGPQENPPAEVTLADPVAMRELAEALGLKWHHVFAVLALNRLAPFADGPGAVEDQPLDFATASLVCAHFGVVVHKAS